MATKLNIWTNAKVPKSAADLLANGVRAHNLIISSQLAGTLGAGGEDPSLAQADIAFGQPDPVQMKILHRLQWVQLSSAGYTRYDRDDLRQAIKARNAAITNSSSVFDEPCAQHLLAFILCDARALAPAIQNQTLARSWPSADLRPKSRLLGGQSVLLLGFGAIARRLVELLVPLRMNITALRQSPRGNEPVPCYSISELDRLLPDFDHVVNILPSSPSTDGLITAARFSAMKPGAIFYNIGRGTTIDQTGLGASLQNGSLGAAYLDVTDPEPLPPDHPLWKFPNCIITPHIGGGFLREAEAVVEHFLENLKQFEAGAPLRDRII